MSRYVYTTHAQLKLKNKTIRKLGINKQKIEGVVEKPFVIDKSEKPVLIAIGNLTDNLSLCVPYKRETNKTKIITFYPAEKGRYEHKILSGR